MNTDTTTQNRIDQLLSHARDIVKTNPSKAAKIIQKALEIKKKARIKKENNSTTVSKNYDNEIVFEMAFFKYCIEQITKQGNISMRPYIRLMKTYFNSDGKIISIGDIGEVHVWIAPKELHNEYEKECRKRNTKPKIFMTSIIRKFRHCSFWVRNAKQPRSWKRKMKDDTISRTWWILNTKLMMEKDKEIFLNLVNDY